MRKSLVAFTGYAGAGKDEASFPLIRAGYKRCCLGDIIKAQQDEVIKKHLGFSAFTEKREHKSLIRRTLESWGEDNYDNILQEFFDRLPPLAVNTRICKLREAEEWHKRGGVIIEVRRPGLRPETDWSLRQVQELRNNKQIDDVLNNAGTLEELHFNVEKMFFL